MVVRFYIVVIIFFLSLCIPNINILLTLTGAVLCTIVNVFIPIIFYLRAYNISDKNVSKEDEPVKDRKWIRYWAYFTLVLGSIVGVWGLVYCIISIAKGAKSDEA